MFETKFDAVKNRVYVKLEGMMTIEEAKEYDMAVRKEVDKAKEGYTFCIDMAKAQPAPADVNDYLSGLRDYMATKKTKGSSMIVSSALTKLQLSRLVKDLGGAYGVAQSYEEADRYLDSL
ncbi:protein kinase [Paenibacillus alvei]|uniref:Protein kinase n=1 Tax=Paenibacillus alvei TaxID=44250 RepID=A0AAP6ZX25_PAEAL|nr:MULTISPECIES: protein kinase [Paenibacillus]MBG9737593.1 protein kinase [Paenibacillus alvei]MBG9747285.1 protein kinase [Paenibacillus alvei]MCY7486234.1 protein kinase [Paenibacillus alvei]MCY9539542.1 protein kinase [Paenibacillus alvei]MCY9581229.1 protein kinase [Paenibacillus alvei]